MVAVDGRAAVPPSWRLTMECRHFRTTRLQLLAARILCFSAVCISTRAYAQSGDTDQPGRRELAAGNLPLEIAGGVAGAALGTIVGFMLEQPLCVEHGHVPGFCLLLEPLGVIAGTGLAVALPSVGVLLAGRATGGTGRLDLTLLVSACVGLAALVPAAAFQAALHEPNVMIPITGGGLAIGSILGYRGSASPGGSLVSRAR